jgi:hypothetical protein
VTGERAPRTGRPCPQIASTRASPRRERPQRNPTATQDPRGNVPTWACGRTGQVRRSSLLVQDIQFRVLLPMPDTHRVLTLGTWSGDVGGPLVRSRRERWSSLACRCFRRAGCSWGSTRASPSSARATHPPTRPRLSLPETKEPLKGPTDPRVPGRRMRRRRSRGRAVPRDRMPVWAHLMPPRRLAARPTRAGAIRTARRVPTTAAGLDNARNAPRATPAALPTCACARASLAGARGAADRPPTTVGAPSTAARAARTSASRRRSWRPAAQNSAARRSTTATRRSTAACSGSSARA